MIGVAMYPKSSTIYGSIVPGAEFIRSLVRQGTISQEAARRLRWFDYYKRCEDARLTCRRPHHVRKPLTPAPIEDRILELRTKYPRWGKDKLVFY
jgi:hypothetical protein